MFRIQKTYFVNWFIVVLGVLTICEYVLAGCPQDCYNDSQSCYTTGKGACDIANDRCYQYFAPGSTFTQSCWVCGGPGSGFCLIGDANLSCNKTTDTICYKYYQQCTADCTNANTYVSAGFFEFPTTFTGDETRYLCGLKKSSSSE